MSSNGDGRLSIGEVARRAGVSVDTVRHYERRGLLPSAERTAAGYRRFLADAAARVVEIRAALAVGFGLRELERIYATRDRGGAPCREVRDSLAAKERELGERIEEMREMRTRLRATLARWDERLATTPPDRRAHLLATLAGEPPRRRPSGRSRKEGSR